MMPERSPSNRPDGNFFIDKWFLDFVADNGEAMIFYAAILGWKGWEVTYASWLQYNPVTGARQNSGFRKIDLPEMRPGTVTWEDSTFGVAGCWQSTTTPLKARLFDSGEGYLDWQCHQPASKVTLTFKDRTITGTGYAEQLVLTVPPWKIPMHELRWGRFGSANHHLVWIELREIEKRQWLWLNGEKITHCTIADDALYLPEQNLVLTLDRSVVLESEKKIYTVVEKLIRFMPGFQKIMPLKFLMAAEYKWMSKGVLLQNNAVISQGSAIHEMVNFNA